MGVVVPAKRPFVLFCGVVTIRVFSLAAGTNLLSEEANIDEYDCAQSCIEDEDCKCVRASARGRACVSPLHATRLVGVPLLAAAAATAAAAAG